MEQVNTGYSMKCIPIGSKMEYKTYLIGKLNLFVERCRWRAFFYLNKDKVSSDKKETYGFKTSNKAPKVIEIAEFERRGNYFN